MYLNILFGRGNLKEGNMTLFAFYRKGMTADKEMPIKKASMQGDLGIGEPFAFKNTAASRTGSEQLGFWATCTYDVKENCLIRLSIQRHIKDVARSSGLSLPKRYQMFIRPRKDAALTELKIELIPSAAANIEHGYITGNFDIIDPDDFDKYGIKDLSRHNRQIDDFDLTVIEEFVEINIKEKASSPPQKPRVSKTASGKTIVKRRGRGRALRK